MDAETPDPAGSLLRSNRADTPPTARVAGVSRATSGKARWGVGRVIGWALVLAWSALLIGTGLTGMFAKAFL